jgi:hypothetical protein
MQIIGPKPRHCAPAREPRVQAWFDGACLNNPGGHSSFGVIVKRDGQTILLLLNTSVRVLTLRITWPNTPESLRSCGF